MKLHHLGWVGKSSSTLARRLEKEDLEPLSGPIDDPIQRVTVQFFRDPHGLVWETVAPLGAPENSPLQSRLARGGGLDHVCFELDDHDPPLDVVVETEVSRGAHVVCAPVAAVAFQRRIAFVLHRSGRLVEYVEPRAPGALF